MGETSERMPLIAFRAPAADLAALKSEAIRRGTTQSELIRQALAAAGINAAHQQAA
jgi:hypothetical protein